MFIVKPIVTIAFLLVYSITCGSITLECDFPDGSQIHFEGWLV